MGNGVTVVPYRAAINIGADNAGLYLSMFLLFRLGTPSLFIPWEHLSVKPPESPTSGVEFRFLAAPSVFLRVGRSLGAAILTHMPTNSKLGHGTGPMNQAQKDFERGIEGMDGTSVKLSNRSRQNGAPNLLS